MAGAISLWGAGELLGNFFGQLTEFPNNFYVALMQDVSPTAFQSGLELDEPAADLGYARVQVVNSTASWTAEFETYSNSTEIRFAAATADWGTVRYWSLCNTATEGNFYFFGELGEEVEVLSTDELVIPVGTLNFTIGPLFAGIEDDS